jgi:hypothetical protein
MRRPFIAQPRRNAKQNQGMSCHILYTMLNHIVIDIQILRLKLNVLIGSGWCCVWPRLSTPCLPARVCRPLAPLRWLCIQDKTLGTEAAEAVSSDKLANGPTGQRDQMCALAPWTRLTLDA